MGKKGRPCSLIAKNAKSHYSQSTMTLFVADNSACRGSGDSGRVDMPRHDPRFRADFDLRDPWILENIFYTDP
jgi:hypothetical protein